MCHKLSFKLYLLIPEVLGTEHVFRFPCGSHCWGEHLRSQEGYWEGECGLPCKAAPTPSPLAQERVQFSRRGQPGLLLHPFSPLSPALGVEKIKFLSPFDLGLVLVYSFIFGHEYFRVPASADITYMDLN